MDSGVVRQVVALAAQAPSLHDSRPWRFVANPYGLDLHADRARQLPALDPAGRQLVLSCGVALGFAQLAVRALGFDCRIDLLPEQGDLDHLARLSIGGPRRVAVDDLALAGQIGRPTAPDRLDRRPLPAVARADLGRDAEVDEAWLCWVDSIADRAAVAVLHDRAEQVQRADPIVRAELDSVLPVLASALAAPTARPRVTGQPEREIGPLDGRRGVEHRHPLAELPDLVVLGTRFDGPVSWLQAGQATARVLLRAGTIDVAACAVPPLLDVPWTTRRLRKQLELPGHPQLVLRLGIRSREDRTTDGRRPALTGGR